MSSIDYARYPTISFDCYGTLIDWESGIVASLRQALPAVSTVEDDVLLEHFSRHELAAEDGDWRPYRTVLADAVRGVARDLHQDVTDAALAAFADSVGAWPAFPDSAAALARLAPQYSLAVITNCDTDLFMASQRRLGVEFDYIITAEMARAYKPRQAPFDAALAVIGQPPDRVLHVAQSLYHDHVPAQRLGFTTVWIDRRHDRGGFGATPPADAAPHARFVSMSDFAAAAAPESSSATTQRPSPPLDDAPPARPGPTR